MNSDDLKWLAGLLIPQIALAATLINTTLNDKVRHPLRVAISLHLLFALILGIIAYLVTRSYWASISIIIETFFLLAVIFYVLKQRDLKGIKLGEHFIEFERVVDVQTSYILGLVERNSYSQIKDAVQQALKYILDVLGEYFGVDNSHHQHGNHYHSLSVLFAKNNGRFEVLAQNGITPIQIEAIESKFRYKPKVVSVAGYVANRGIFVCISDLSVVKGPDDPVNYWVKSENHEKQEGFLLCYPILRGIGKPPLKPLAVICLSSHMKGAYDDDTSKQILDRIAPKIENLLTIYRKFAL